MLRSGHRTRTACSRAKFSFFCIKSTDEKNIYFSTDPPEDNQNVSASSRNRLNEISLYRSLNFITTKLLGKRTANCP